MALPRRLQISLEHTPYYHCVSRCVRRAFLCGNDRYSGRNFDHRKSWLAQRLILLSDVFAIELLAYAIMSNHYHLVVRINEESSERWSDDAVVSRWKRLFALPERVTDRHISVWRERLRSLSWYMRCINEPIARRANREDECTGRFWEGRFTSQALLDEPALLKCMTYVDLNPVRADIARTPERSAYTSIKARIDGNDLHLAPFYDQPPGRFQPVPMRRNDYLTLIDWTGRQFVRGKRGRIPIELPSILARLHTRPNQWVLEMRHFGRWYYRAVGSWIALDNYCRHLGQQWLKGSAGVAARTSEDFGVR